MTQLQIVNLAMNHLGLSELANLTDDEPKVDCANTFWEPARDDTFRRGWWAFATTQVELTEIDDTEADVEGWDYTYTMPSNCMAIQAVYDSNTTETKYMQEWEQQYSITMNTTVLLSNLGTALADITYKVTDVALWTPDFVLAFSYQLAGLMAHQLTGDPNIGIKMGQLASMYIDETKRVSQRHKKKEIGQKIGYRDAR